MECAQCGAQVPAGRRSCPACGTSAPRAESAVTPEGVEALLAEANLFRTRGQFDEAISACMRALQHDAANAAAHSLIADIYRDQGNYREALNWFKLAVELNPDNEADKRKLDEMIDRVFQGVLAGELRTSVKAMAQPQAASTAAPGKPAPAGYIVRLRAFLARLQPTYVAVALALVLVAVFSLLTWKLWSPGTRANGGHPRAGIHTSSDRLDNGSDSGENASATAVNIVPTVPQITPPPPDAVENGVGQPRPVDGLPGVVVTPSPGTSPPSKPAPNPVTTPAVPPAPNDTTASENSPQVPPLSPLTAAGSDADKVELQVLLLKMALERALESSKLPSTLDAVTIDPRTNVLTVKFTIPHMRSATEMKQGLLYTGFHLVWTAAEQNGTLSGFTLLGNAYSSAAHEPSLALVADVSAEQAKTARTAVDYKTVQQYLTKPWWRADLAGATL